MKNEKRVAMNKGQTVEWLRLDNAGKIFPATSGKRNTSVFRFSCELFENIDPEKLQQAALLTAEEFPHFLSIMRAGLFWHYLEMSELKPLVHEENRHVCSPIFSRYNQKLLFDVSYYQNRINLEVYHALADGTGSLHFLKAMIYHYITILHSEIESGEKIPRQYSAPYSVRVEDGFRKYYRKEIRKRSLKPQKAYKIKGVKTVPGSYLCIDGVMECDKVLQLAKSYGASLTVFLAAVLIRAIHMERQKSKENQNIVITVPVDLRKYFPSDTARNFFGNIRVAYNCEHDGESLEDIIGCIKAGFKEELTEEKLSKRLSRLMFFENHPMIRIAPLFLKNWSLRMVRKFSDAEETTVISNVGKVELPEEFKKYVKQVNVFVSTGGLQLCACAYENRLSTTFTSVFTETDIQRNFYRSFTELGIKVEIRSNM